MKFLNTESIGLCLGGKDIFKVVSILLLYLSTKTGRCAISNFNWIKLPEFRQIPC